jgi:S-adenosylmethionine/arginine decarboxylase-like enzyme
MQIFGQELSADLAVPAARLGDPRVVEAALLAGAAGVGCTVLSAHHQLFEPAGVTAIVIIGESHLLMSTYPELGVAAVNIQTCSRDMELLPGLAAICGVLGAEAVRSLVLMRHLDTPFRIELACEMVPFRDGRLRFEEALALAEAPGGRSWALRFLGQQGDQIAVAPQPRRAAVEGGERPRQGAGPPRE